MPWESVKECREVRGVLKVVNLNDYNRILSKPGSSSYRRYVELGVRSFIKGYLLDEPLYGLKKDDFKRYQDIVDFVKGYEPAKSLRVSQDSISKLRHRKMLIRNVPKIRETKEFANYVVGKIPHFNVNLFIKGLGPDDFDENGLLKI
jgi:hypothetical protein